MERRMDGGMDKGVDGGREEGMGGLRDGWRDRGMDGRLDPAGPVPPSPVLSPPAGDALGGLSPRPQGGIPPHLLSCCGVSLPLVSPGDSNKLRPGSPPPSSAWAATMSPASSRSSRWLTEKFFLPCKLSKPAGPSRRAGSRACLSMAWA